MKRYGLRILLALLTFALGLCVAAIVKFRLAPVAKVETVSVGANIQAQLPPTQIAEEAHSTHKVDDDLPLPQNVYKPIQPHPVSISPYKIKWLVDNADSRDLKSIWQKLKIAVPDGIALFDGLEGCHQAIIYTIELDGKPGVETLLKLDFGMPEATLYLIFNYISGRYNAGWNLLGSIPYYYGAPFVSPSQKVISNGQHHWLIIDYSTGHGSGFGSGADDWFEVSESGVRKVLSYQNGFYLGIADPIVDRSVKVWKVEKRDGVATVVLQVSTSYGYYEKISDKVVNLWTNHRRATFRKGARANQFVFDPLNSEITEGELDPSKDQDLDSRKDFLQYNYQELEKIATGRNGKRKEWLRNYLKDCIKDCDEGAEKQSLQKLLEGAQP